MTKIAEFANSVDLDEVAHNEPPHLDLHCLTSSPWILNMIQFGRKIFWKFADENIVVCFSVVKELNFCQVSGLTLFIYSASLGDLAFCYFSG